jgi:hypothetical protein
MAGDILWKLDGELIGPELGKLQEKVDTTTKPLEIDVYRGKKLVHLSVQPYKLAQSNEFHFVEFASCMFFSKDERTEYNTGDGMQGVYMTAVKNGTSPFKKVLQNSWFGNSIVRITQINEYVINTLQDLEKIIPLLINQNTLEIRYINYMGERYGDMAEKSANRQERYVVAKYDAKFDSPKSYVFDPVKMEWDVHSFKTQATDAHEGSKPVAVK